MHGERKPRQHRSIQAQGMVIEIPIHDLGHRGEGVGRYKGQTVFVPGAFPGDIVLACPTQVSNRFMRANLVKVVVESPNRVGHRCPSVSQCGGCQLQQLSYPAQLDWKKERVEQVLARLGGVTAPRVNSILRCSRPYAYRNKAQYPVGQVDGNLRLGFFERGSHRLVPAEECLLQHPRMRKAAVVLTGELQAIGIGPYREEDHSGQLRHVLLRASFSYDELLVTLVMREAAFSGQDHLITTLRQELPDLVGITVNINDLPGNRVLGPQNITLWGRPYLRESLRVDGMSLEFHISPPSFFQVNPIQAEVLFGVVLKYAAVHAHSRVLDAYCGTGSIALFLAAAGAKQVVGVEEIDEAVADAWENAQVNDIQNVKFIRGLVEETLDDIVAQEGIPDLLVVDPPRAGLNSAFLKRAGEWGIPRWLYVSCNPPTLARDTRILSDFGYNLIEVQPVDMFPHTAHIECVALFTREGS